MISMTFSGGVFGPVIQEKERKQAQNTPNKSHIYIYISYFWRAQIRWVIWRSSKVWKKVWRKSVNNSQTILPFSCCPLVFLWPVAHPAFGEHTRQPREGQEKGVANKGGKKEKRAKKSTQTFFVQSFSTTLRVMDVCAENYGRLHQKVRFPAVPRWGETFWPLGIRA